MQFKELCKKLERLNLPDQLTLTNQEKIIDLPKFVRSHIKIVSANSGNRVFLPYYNRLLKVYHLCK